jgi:TP901 family phage tail tape measure protein
MADVDLTVLVREAGVGNAIKSINALRNAGIAAGTGLSRLAATSAAYGRSVNEAMKSTAGAVNTSKVSASASRADTAAKALLTKQLNRLNAEYTRLSVLQPNATARQRLATAGGRGGLQGGIATALQAENLQQQLGANLAQDRMTVQRQQMALEDSRANKAAAQASVRAAQDRRELMGMDAKSRAALVLTRAEEAYNRAVAARKATPAAANNPEQINQRTAALQNEAKAYDDVTDAQQGVADSLQSGSDNAFQSSYSYFILAGLATQAAQAIYGVASATLQSSAQIERSFADVERTFEGTSFQLESLREKMFQLSTQSPISTVALSEIATLGNQLGVQAKDIESFTQVIAQYTAVSGQSAEDAATAFGRISNLTGLAASEYGNLSSAITYTARTTVATEASIQNTSKEITALASGAGFSADAIVGLAGALSSLAIPPERARGALSLYFGALNGAVAEGGPKLAAFSELTGVTADQLDKLVRQNRGQEVFTSFIEGLSDLDTVAKTSALDTLGLSTIRVDQTMRALSGNVPLVTKSFEGATRAFQENTEIGTQYALIQETLNSKWLEFQNSVQNAAAALGDNFAPMAKVALAAATDLIVAVREFSNTPFGQAILTAASALSLLVGAIAGLVGIAALAKASLVVLQFAVSGLGWSTATKGLLGYAAGLTITDRAARASALSATSFKAAWAESTAGMTRATVASKALAVGLNFLKVALPLIAITVAIGLIGELIKAVDLAANPSKKLSDDLSGLTEALKVDNPGLGVSEAVKTLGSTMDSAGKPLSGFNQSILAAIDVQQQAEQAVDGTTGALDKQKVALGETSKAWIDEALKSQTDLAGILDGQAWYERNDNESTMGMGSSMGKSNVTRTELAAFIRGGLELDEISRIAVEDGEEAAKAAYYSWKEGFDKENPNLFNATSNFGTSVLLGIIPSVIDSYKKGSTEAALFGEKTTELGTATSSAADEFNTMNEYTGEMVANGEAVAVTFTGITNRLDDFRDSVQKSMSKYVEFGDILNRAKKTATDAQKALEDSTGKKQPLGEVGAAEFGVALSASVADAEKFFSEITQLAESGSTSFALQLAALGPESQAILSSALTLKPDAAKNLEAEARFAAFLASDAFKKQLELEMADSNGAYAQILKGDGNLGDVKSFIAAQVAGTGAAWEQAWLLEKPDFPLNIDPEFTDLSQSEIDTISDRLSGRIVVTPKMKLDIEAAEGTRYTNLESGGSMTISADLDDAALTAAISIWEANQNSTPAELASLLNTDGLSPALDAWRNARGPIAVTAVVTPVLTPGAVQRLFSTQTSVGVLRSQQHGGPIDRRETPKFATGGMYGRFSGPGNGTSDSILARVSNGEYINNAASTNFWGADFFDSLNRKMLPTSFMNMLGAASSGGGGPQSVTNVNVNQINPVTRDPLKQLRENSEMVAAGIWS